MKKLNYSSLAFTCFLLLLFSWMAWSALEFRKLASYFPLYIALFAAILTIIQLVIEVSKYGKQPLQKKDDETHTSAELKYILWFVGYLAIVLLVGFIGGTSIFLLSFLKLETKYSWMKAALSTMIAIGLVVMFGKLMNLYWPSGWLY